MFGRISRLSPRFFSAQAPQDFVSCLLKTKSIAHDLNAIYKHSFNQQLFDGTLSAAAFGHYLNDDYYYLHHYALTLKKLGIKTRPINNVLANQLDYLAADIISGEQQMQEQYDEYFAYRLKNQPGTVISNYVTFLKTQAETTHLNVALCSILPCFWTYYQLGTKPLLSKQLQLNPYRQWITTYSSPDFINATKQLRETINQMAKESDAQLQDEMKNAFSTAVKFELEFFNEIFTLTHQSSPML